MATHRIPIFGQNTAPDTVGGTYWEPWSIKATTARFDPDVLIFSDGGSKYTVHGAFTVPKNYVGGPGIILVWTSDASTPSGNLIMDFEYRAIGGTESLDQTSQQEAKTETITWAGSQFDRQEDEITGITAGNFAVDDTVLFELGRDNTASDTLNSAAIVFQVLFEYDDA